MPQSIQEQIVAMVQRDLAQQRARDEALALAPRSMRRTTGPTVVFSVRLDRAELAALEGKAAVYGIKPSVLARNLIRTGLTARNGAELAEAVDRLEAAMAEVRAAVL